MPDPDTNLEDLRKRAGELDITGRSKMSAEDLATAIGIAERNREQTAAAIEARVAVAAGADEQRYSVARLRRTPTILGHPVAVVAAAFADAGVSDDDELTRAQVDELIRRSQERPVRTDEEA